MVGIIASVALLQVSQLHDTDNRKTWDACASLLLHLQVLATRCRQGRSESDGGPILPAVALSTAGGQTQWPQDHRWAAASDATAVKIPVVEPRHQLPDTTASVDHGAAESLLSEHKNSSDKLLSPKKKAAPSVKPIHTSPPASLVRPKPSKPGAAAPSTPTRADSQLLGLPPHPQSDSIQSARAGSLAIPALNSLTPIPETEAVAAPLPHSDTTHPAQPPVPPSSPLSEPPNSDAEASQSESGLLPLFIEQRTLTHPSQDLSESGRLVPQRMPPSAQRRLIPSPGSSQRAVARTPWTTRKVRDPRRQGDLLVRVAKRTQRHHKP